MLSVWGEGGVGSDADLLVTGYTEAAGVGVPGTDLTHIEGVRQDTDLRETL